MAQSRNAVPPGPRILDRDVPMTPYERIDHAIDAASEGLRALSLDIHAHPELNFEEHHAHQVLTDNLDAEGFEEIGRAHV